MNCYKCKKDLGGSGDNVIIGLHVKFDMEKEVKADQEALKIQAGKYFDQICSEEGLNLCFECWIDGVLFTGSRKGEGNVETDQN